MADGQRGGDINSVDACQIHTAYLEELRAQIELGRIASAPALLAFGGFSIVCLQLLELLLNFDVALGQLRADEFERSQCLLEREQVFGSPVSL